MPRKSSIVMHPKKLEMEREYMEGQPVSEIARKYGVSADALYHHTEHNLSRQLVQAYQQKELNESMDILGGIEDLLKKTRRILDHAEKDKKHRLALSAIKEARGSYELLSKIAYALHQARLAEIELERLQQATNHDDTEEQVAEAIKILSFDELKVLERLTRKIRTQNPKFNALPKVYRNLDLPVPEGIWDSETEQYELSDPESFQPDNDSQDEYDLVMDDLSVEINSEETDPEWLRQDRLRRTR